MNSHIFYKTVKSNLQLFFVGFFSLLLVSSCNDDIVNVGGDDLPEIIQGEYNLGEYDFTYKVNSIQSAPQELIQLLKQDLVKSKHVNHSDLESFGDVKWNWNVLDYTSDTKYIISIPVLLENSISGILIFSSEVDHEHFYFNSINELKLETDNFSRADIDNSLKLILLKYSIFANIMGADIDSAVYDLATKITSGGPDEEPLVEARGVFFIINVLVATEISEIAGAIETTNIYDQYHIFVECPPELTADDEPGDPGPGGTTGGNEDPIVLECENMSSETIAIAAGIFDPCDPGTPIGINALNDLCSLEGDITPGHVHDYLEQEGQNYVDINNNLINGQTPEELGYPAGTNVSDIPADELCESEECESIEFQSQVVGTSLLVITNSSCILQSGVSLRINVTSESKCCVYEDDSKEVLDCKFSHTIEKVGGTWLFDAEISSSMTVNRGVATVQIQIGTTLLDFDISECNYSRDITLDGTQCKCT